MGFFGMFNYNKDGPGVDKDAPASSEAKIR